MSDSDLRIRLKVDGIETLGALKFAIRDAKKELDKLPAGSSEFNALKQTIKNTQDHVKSLSQTTQSETSKMMSNYFRLGESLRSVESAFLKVTAAVAATHFLREISESAASVSMLRIELDRLGAIKKIDVNELLLQMREATDGNVKNVDLLRIALQSIRLGNIDLVQLPKVMEILGYNSKLLGEDINTLWQKFIRGAEGGRKSGLLALGIMVDARQAAKDYAEQQNIALKNLSEEEKRAINVKAAFDALQETYVSTESAASTTLETFDRFDRVFDKLKTEVGTAIGDDLAKALLSVGYAALIATEGMKSYITGVGLYYKIVTTPLTVFKDETFKEHFKSIQDSFQSMGNIGWNIREQWTKIVELWSKAKEPEVKRTKGVIGGVTPSIAHVASREETEDATKKSNKDFKDQLDILTKQYEQGELSHKQYLESLLVQEKLVKTDAQRLELGERRLKLEKDDYKQSVDNYRETVTILDRQLELEELTTNEYIKRLKAIRELAPNKLATQDIDIRIRRAELKGADDLTKKYTFLVNGMLSGFNAVGQSVQTNLHDGLVNAFHGADSVAQKFIIGVIDGISAIASELASKAIVSGILSLVTGGASGGFSTIFNLLSGGLSKTLGFADGGYITEPVFGVGASGKSYTFGERGTEYISSNASLQNSLMQDRYSNMSAASGQGKPSVINLQLGNKTVERVILHANGNIQKMRLAV